MNIDKKCTMLFQKRKRDIPGEYLKYVINITNSIFQDADIDDLLKGSLKPLNFEFICIACIAEGKISIPFSTHPYLKGASGDNILLLQHIEDKETLLEDHVNNVFAGLVDLNIIEDIQYSRRIKHLIGIPIDSYIIIAGSSDEIVQEKHRLLEILLKGINTYHDKIVIERERANFLENENKMLNSLQSFTNFAITKTDFKEIADFAVNQLNIEMDYPAVFIAVKEKGTWKPLSLTSSPIITKALELLGKPYESFRLEPSEAELNMLISHLTKLSTFTTSNLRDMLSPPVEAEIIDKIQRALGVQIIYAVPIHHMGNILGTIIYMSKNKEIKKSEESILTNYGIQLGIAMGNAISSENIQKSKESLENAYKNIEEIAKEKDNLMSMASHELRTPATVARNAISLILEYKTEIDPKIMDKMDMIKEAADRELSIINTMLEVSRINTKKMELVYQQVKIEKLISMAVEELAIEAEKKGLKMDYIQKDSPIPDIKADATRIREVVDNLLTNAIKYTDTGTITITTGINNGFVEISIADTGKGIPEEMQKTLFQMFHRITNTNLPYTQQQSHQGGLGLGLYIVKNIIDAHSGTIIVTSKENEGSTFTFKLPI